MSATYRIKDWDKHFENHESRKVKGVRWVALPNKHDGKSYRRLTHLPNAPEIFAAWVLILEVASKMPERGILADEDGPLNSSDLSAMTGFPAEIFDEAFKALTEKRIGWLEEISETSRDVPELPATVPESPGISRNFPASPGMTGKSAVEGKGTERNKTTALRAVPISDSDHKRLMAELQNRSGPFSDGAAQGKAIKWLLKHYDAETCVRCLTSIKEETWRKTRVSWLTVEKEIGDWLKRQEPKARGMVL